MPKDRRSGGKCKNGSVCQGAEDINVLEENEKAGLKELEASKKRAAEAVEGPRARQKNGSTLVPTSTSLT